MKRSEQKLHMKDDAKQKWPSQKPVSAHSKVEKILPVEGAVCKSSLLNIPSYVQARRQRVQMCSSPISQSRLTQLIHHYKAEPLLLSCVPLPLRVI